MVVGPAAKLEAAARDTANTKAGFNKRLNRDEVAVVGEKLDKRMTKLLK